MRSVVFELLKDSASLNEVLLDSSAVCVTDSSGEYVISRRTDYNARICLSNFDQQFIKRIAEYAIAKQTISASAIQRQFKMGYARACNILEYMEEKGYISSASGIEPRKVFITQSQIDDNFT